MIYWQDFVLDDVFGPLLNMEEQDKVRRAKPRLGGTGVNDDARAKIQETGTEQRPARMVGLSGLDSIKNSNAQLDMEVDRSYRAEEIVRQRGKA